MLAAFWFTFLYQPLFNALIWLYSNLAGNNLGWAVVWLTILLRVALLPLTIVSERNALRKRNAQLEADEAVGAFKNDLVAQKETARRVMKKYKMSPWAKVLSLAIQLLVLVLLYQVFIRGISNEKIAKLLYPAVEFPGIINTNFYSFEIGATNTLMWPIIAAAYLLVSVIISERGHGKYNKSEMYYILFFPIFTFIALWYLPLVKSLFILTTMLFSDTISILSRLLFPSKYKLKTAPVSVIEKKSIKQ